MHLQTPNCPGSVTVGVAQSRRPASKTSAGRRVTLASSFLHPFTFFPTSPVSPFSLFLVSIVESGRCPIVIMAAGKASGKAAASFDEIIRAGTATDRKSVV